MCITFSPKGVMSPQIGITDLQNHASVIGFSLEPVFRQCKMDGLFYYLLFNNEEIFF